VTNHEQFENEIDRIASELEEEVAGLRQFQNLLRKNPAMAQRLRTVMGAPVPVSGTNGHEPKVRRPNAVGAAHHDLIKQYLLSKGNKPQRAPDIMAGTGLSRTQVSTVLYKTRRDDFVAVRADGKHPLWQLKNLEETPGH